MRNMSLLPKIKECPNCSTINFLRINGEAYDNVFASLNGLTLKKRFNCRKCKIELGLFVKNSSKEEKLQYKTKFMHLNHTPPATKIC